MNSTGHYDLAVVGSGIAGLYCCLHAPAGMKIAPETILAYGMRD